MSSRRKVLLATLYLAWAGSAAATETVTYTYDAKGRLVKVTRTGTANNNVSTTYIHDKADNRVHVTVAGAPS